MIPGPGGRTGVDVGGVIVGVGRQGPQLTLFGNLGMAGITHWMLITNDDSLDLVGGATTSYVSYILLLSGRVVE